MNNLKKEISMNDLLEEKTMENIVNKSVQNMREVVISLPELCSALVIFCPDNEYSDIKKACEKAIGDLSNLNIKGIT